MIVDKELANALIDAIKANSSYVISFFNSVAGEEYSFVTLGAMQYILTVRYNGHSFFDCVENNDWVEYND